jgi:hypothetical protein
MTAIKRNQPDKAGTSTRKTDGPIGKPWTYLLIYWTTGWAVALWKDYLSLWATPSLTLWHFAALTLTILLQSHLNKRFSNYGRRPDYFGITCFALFNGVAETMLFLAYYDYGRVTLAEQMGLTLYPSIALGFLTYSIYCTLIHAFFWDQLILPLHLRLDARPFHRDGLPALLALSMVWLALYEVHGDVSTVCILHILVDFMVGHNIAYPSLFQSQ